MAQFQEHLQILGTVVRLSGNFLDTRNSGTAIMELLYTKSIGATTWELYIDTRNSGATIMELSRN